MFVEISEGELIDKITILEIKMEKIQDASKIANVKKELDMLYTKEFYTSRKEELKSVNLKLWDIEDRLRVLEKMNDFGEEFIQNARFVYKLNDERARIKKNINYESGSSLTEEKSY